MSNDFNPQAARFTSRGKIGFHVFAIFSNKDIVRYHYGDGETIYEKSVSEFNRLFAR